MSTRTSLPPQIVLNAASMAGSLISSPTILQSLSKIAYQAVWTGTSPVGTISIQGSENYSLNPNGQVNNTGTWTTLTLAYNGTLVTSVPVTGNTGDALIDLETGIYALRLIYTRTSGTGTITVTTSGKVA